MKIESGKVVKLSIVNHVAGGEAAAGGCGEIGGKVNGEVWCTLEQEALYPDGFTYAPLRDLLLGMSPEENGALANDYLGDLRYSAELVFKLPIANFKADEDLRIGMVFKARVQMKTFTGRVTAIDSEYVTLDCNHPYVGHSTFRTVYTVMDVRDPTEAELSGGFKPSLIAL